MALKSSLVFEPATSIEVFFDNIIEVGTTQTREIKNYDARSAPEIKIRARNRHPSNTAYQGSIQTDIIEKKRKLVYLNAYADKVIVIDGGNKNAIYGNINPLDISDRNTLVPDIEFTAVAKGGVTGQYIPADDFTTTGVTTDDTDAVDGRFTQFDAVGEYAYIQFDQNNYQLPVGDYIFFTRVKSAFKLANDFIMEVLNVDDTTTLGTGTITLFNAYQYESIQFTVSDSDLGDTIKFNVRKATAPLDIIAVDFMGFAKV